MERCMFSAFLIFFFTLSWVRHLTTYLFRRRKRGKFYIPYLTPKSEVVESSNFACG